jgi:hypothetical protein
VVVGGRGRPLEVARCSEDDANRARSLEGAVEGLEEKDVHPGFGGYESSVFAAASST